MYRTDRAETLLSRGRVFKNVTIGAGQALVAVWALLLLVEGSVVASIGVLIVGSFVSYIVLDILSGLLLLPLAAAGAFVDRRSRRKNQMMLRRIDERYDRLHDHGLSPPNLHGELLLDDRNPGSLRYELEERFGTDDAQKLLNVMRGVYGIPPALSHATER